MVSLADQLAPGPVALYAGFLRYTLGSSCLPSKYFNHSTLSPVYTLIFSDNLPLGTLTWPLQPTSGPEPHSFFYLQRLAAHSGNPDEG